MAFLIPPACRTFGDPQKFANGLGLGAGAPGQTQHRDFQMINGTVKFFNSTKGFGFIQPDDGSADTFVHISAVEKAGLSGLNEGQKVTFDVEEGRDGRASATNLAVV